MSPLENPSHRKFIGNTCSGRNGYAAAEIEIRGREASSLPIFIDRPVAVVELHHHANPVWAPKPAPDPAQLPQAWVYSGCEPPSDGLGSVNRLPPPGCRLRPDPTKILQRFQYH